MKFFLLIFGFFFSFSAFAADPNSLLDSVVPDDGTVIKQDWLSTDGIKNSKFVTDLVPNGIEILFNLATAIAVLSIIYAGFTILTTLGEQDKFWKGWKIFGYSLGGLALMIFSRFIVGLVENLKISDLKANPSKYGLSSDGLSALPSGEIETQIVPTLISNFLQIVSLVILGIVIYAGIIYVTSNDDDKKSKMPSVFIDGIIGLIVILTSYALIAGFLAIDFGS